MTHLDEEFKKQDAEELRSLLSKQVWQTSLECEQSLISESSRVKCATRLCAGNVVSDQNGVQHSLSLR